MPIFIAYGLGVIEDLCEIVPVIYLGTLVDSGPTAAVVAPLSAVTRPNRRAGAFRFGTEVFHAQ